MRGFLKNTALLLISLALALAVLEGLSRLVYPIQYGHKSFDLDGNPVYPATDYLGVVPNLTYRQRAQEFDTLTTHTARGFRGPKDSFMDPPNPEVLFVGDSMTYGVGLADDQTIPYLYCKETGKTCANLGRPGSGTREAVNIIENRIKNDGWRPLEVKLIMNVMTAAQFGGNDLTDNLQAPPQTATTPSVQETAASETVAIKPRLPTFTHNDVLERSNLARLTYYIFAPMIRRWMTPDIDKDMLEKSLSATHDELARLDMLSQRYAFTYMIYIVHPMQDLTRGTWVQTRNHINAIAPHGQVIDTAPALLEGGDPVSYYYPLDGHVRPEGAAKIAAFMADND
jgi:hypothetical protein